MLPLLELAQAGGDTVAFLKFTMLPLLTSDTATYKILKLDVFGAESHSNSARVEPKTEIKIPLD